MTQMIQPSDTSAPADLPTFEDVKAAATRLRGLAVRTPLIESPALNAAVGGRVLMKAETLQRTGSFKFRGAFNRISQIPDRDKAGGVVAYSSGNHAQGVAAAAALLGLPAVIVMPADAPAIKVENTRGYGAEVVFYDRYKESREEIGLAIAADRKATLVKPYDDPGVIAGQGTCGLEIFEEATARETKLDRLLVCCGGGGFTAGCALALEALSPSTQLFVVEPQGYDDTRLSFEAGHPVPHGDAAPSICDALLSPTPGDITFAVNQRIASGGLTVTDTEVKAAMRYAFRTLKLVVEPGGAVCLAAVLAGKIDVADRVLGLTLSGGNVDAELYCAILSEDD
ncbi:threonine/serine dehydratase [Pelagibius sp. CAU 1746]|uniref:threonine ammonia-lyase n=1 Tax=Pelagibius sp. CAU 1746 TaxID=3140370 RepID=UPI00325B48DA